MADQAANGGGGQAAGNRYVQFSRGAAQRIAKVVRVVEAGNRTQGGLAFEHPISSGGSVKLVRRATFTGAWPIGTTAVVTLVQAPTATVNATNLTWPLDASNPSQQTCLVGKEGANWWLIVPRLSVLSCDAQASGQQLSFFSG